MLTKASPAYTRRGFCLDLTTLDEFCDVRLGPRQQVKKDGGGGEQVEAAVSQKQHLQRRYFNLFPTFSATTDISRRGKCWVSVVAFFSLFLDFIRHLCRQLCPASSNNHITIHRFAACRKSGRPVPTAVKYLRKQDPEKRPKRRRAFSPVGVQCVLTRCEDGLVVIQVTGPLTADCFFHGDALKNRLLINFNNHVQSCGDLDQWALMCKHGLVSKCANLS